MAITTSKRPAQSHRPSAQKTAPALNSFLEPWHRLWLRLNSRITPQETMFLLSQLSLMLEIGMSVKNALAAVGAQTKNPALGDVIKTMVIEIEEGRQLSDAMGKHPRVFDKVSVSMIRAGETGGFLKGILDRIIEMQTKKQKLAAEVRSALTYPVVLSVLGFTVVIFVVVGVLPKFTQFFAGKEALLPFTTRFLMAASASCRAYWWLYITGIMAALVALAWWRDSPAGRALLDRFWVTAPVLGRLFRKVYTGNLLRILGHLMASQVPLLEALRVTQATMQNQFFSAFLEDIQHHVQQGGKLSKMFASNPYIPVTVKEMIAAGEEAGKLSPVMLRLAQHYDEEVDQEIKTLSSLIEPLGLLVMGGVVGMIVSAIVLPLFSVAQAIR